MRAKKIKIEALEMQLREVRRLSGQTESPEALREFSKKRIEILDKMIALHNKN